MKRHPERSEGSLAIARHDRVGAVSPSLLFCRPEPTFFCRPERSEGSPPGDAVPIEVRDASLSLGRTGWDVAPSLFCRPERPFSVAPSASEGSLGAYAPRNDTKRTVSSGIFIEAVPRKLACKQNIC